MKACFFTSILITHIPNVFRVFGIYNFVMECESYEYLAESAHEYIFLLSHGTIRKRVFSHLRASNSKKIECMCTYNQRAPFAPIFSVSNIVLFFYTVLKMFICFTNGNA